MLLKKLILIIPIILLNFSTAQRKKTDTVYIYESVTVYDTIYMEKPIKLTPKSFDFPKAEITAKEIRDIYREKRAEEENSKKILKRVYSLRYGVNFGIGLKNSDWAKFLSEKKQQFGEYAGIWISKNIFRPELTLMLSADIYHWNSTFDLDANREETYLNGYYFSSDQQPLLFQKFNNKHLEYSLQLKLLYNWRDFQPYLGISANKNTYKMQFIVPEEGVLNKLDNFKTDQINLGFSAGIQYQVIRNLSVALGYQQYSMKNLSLKNTSFDFEIFKSNYTFEERKITLGVSYNLAP